MGSPVTNTLPIRNLGLTPEEEREIRMACIRIPHLAVSPQAQTYARLDAGEPPRRFRYRNVASGFTADLMVDDEGSSSTIPASGAGADEGRCRPAQPRFSSLKKSLPLSSMTMKAGKSTTSMRQMASMPSSGYSTTSTFLMQSCARRAAGPPMEPR